MFSTLLSLHFLSIWQGEFIEIFLFLITICTCIIHHKSSKTELYQIPLYISGYMIWNVTGLAITAYFFVYIYRATNILYSSLLLILTSACIIDNNKSYLLEVHARLGPKQNAKAWSWFTFISGLLNAETGITIGKLFSVLIGKLTLVIWRLYSVALSR